MKGRRLIGRGVRRGRLPATSAYFVMADLGRGPDSTSGKRYLGGAQFLNPAGAVAATTALLVETNDPLPLVLSGPRPKSAITK